MTSPLPVSVCIPVRNEALNIAACIDSLAGHFDDVVVVDSASTDRTAEIAASRGARVVQFAWNGRFPKKRNWALRTVDFAHDWILFLDADERISPEVAAEIHDVLPATAHVGFWLSFRNHFMGCELRHGDRFRKLALFRRDAGEYEAFPESLWSGLDMEVHEHPVLRGSTGEIHSLLDHRDDRGLHHYIAKHNEYSSWEANRFRWLATAGSEAWAGLNRRQRFKYRNLDAWWLGHLYYWICVVAKRGFLDGAAGWRFAAMKRRYFQDVRLKILEDRIRDGRS
jgi:glycosyltransferase involved in cell wall biosynthesis